MTHDELLEKINRYSLRTSMLDTLGWNALRAVVELHKPKKIPDWVHVDGLMCWCAHMYPCPTIKAIEKELA